MARFFTLQEIDAWGADAPKSILEKDRAAIDACDAVAALLDGTQVDDGAAWEIGYAHARGRPVVGIGTDFRNARRHHAWMCQCHDRGKLCWHCQ